MQMYVWHLDGGAPLAPVNPHADSINGAIAVVCSYLRGRDGNVNCLVPDALRVTAIVSSPTFSHLDFLYRIHLSGRLNETTSYLTWYLHLS
ncbi:hypothetical protein AX14_005862 [Amanita brunnescens Koide BX004]|nr:hypothetical protein AX14_005862 [Amanita brunnescens Koide BX004]